MFFWFTDETFSLLDAFTKLILLLTICAIIIWLCHRATNYKKTRRYKYDFSQAAAEAAAHAAAAAAAAAAATTTNTTTANLDPSSANIGQQTYRIDNSFSAGTGTESNSSISIDPYNQIRPIFGGPFLSPQARQAYLSAGQTFHVPLGAVAYGYHHPAGAAAALAALDDTTIGTTIATTENELQQQQQQPCPSYEEAVASSGAAASQTIESSSADILPTTAPG